MKLYYKPGACSLASHIILHEIGKPFEIEKVDTAARLTETGRRYDTINPKGVVPVLETGAGETLTEGAAILQYLADSAGETGLAPEAGTMARARVAEVLNFVASELQVAFGPLFSDAADDAAREAGRARVAGKLDWLEGLLADGRVYLTGAQFTVADAYVFVVAGWSRFKGIDLARWPKVQALMDRVATRPAAMAAMKAEGLI